MHFRSRKFAPALRKWCPLSLIFPSVLISLLCVCCILLTQQRRLFSRVASHCSSASEHSPSTPPHAQTVSRRERACAAEAAARAAATAGGGRPRCQATAERARQVREDRDRRRLTHCRHNHSPRLLCFAHSVSSLLCPLRACASCSLSAMSWLDSVSLSFLAPVNARVLAEYRGLVAAAPEAVQAPLAVAETYYHWAMSKQDPRVKVCNQHCSLQRSAAATQPQTIRARSVRSAPSQLTAHPTAHLFSLSVCLPSFVRCVCLFVAC